MSLIHDIKIRNIEVSGSITSVSTGLFLVISGASSNATVIYE